MRMLRVKDEDFLMTNIPEQVENILIALAQQNKEQALKIGKNRADLNQLNLRVPAMKREIEEFKKIVAELRKQLPPPLIANEDQSPGHAEFQRRFKDV